MANKKTTISIIKADVGGFVGHCTMHSALMEKAKEMLDAAKKNGGAL